LKPWCPPLRPVQLPVRWQQQHMHVTPTVHHLLTFLSVWTRGTIRALFKPDFRKKGPQVSHLCPLRCEDEHYYGALVAWYWEWGPKHFEKIQSQWRFVHYTSHMDWAGIEPRSPPSLTSVCLKSGSAFVSISESSSCLTENSPLLGFEVQPLKFFWVGNNRRLFTDS
jgi:hypothetical protein